jgi:hypothetical protein
LRWYSIGVLDTTVFGTKKGVFLVFYFYFFVYFYKFGCYKNPFPSRFGTSTGPKNVKKWLGDPSPPKKSGARKNEIPQETALRNYISGYALFARFGGWGGA